MHNRTDSRLRARQDGYTADCRNTMLFIVGVGIMLVAVGITPWTWLPRGANSADLGWMSEQWLSEHRASHSI